MGLDGYIDVEAEVEIPVNIDDPDGPTKTIIDSFRIMGSQFGLEETSIWKAFHNDPEFAIEYFVDQISRASPWIHPWGLADRKCA